MKAVTIDYIQSYTNSGFATANLYECFPGHILRFAMCVCGGSVVELLLNHGRMKKECNNESNAIKKDYGLQISEKLEQIVVAVTDIRF